MPHPKFTIYIVADDTNQDERQKPSKITKYPCETMIPKVETYIPEYVAVERMMAAFNLGKSLDEIVEESLGQEKGEMLKIRGKPT